MSLIVIDNEHIELPQWVLDVIDALPAKIDRRDGAALVTKYVFQTSRTTVKSWPLPWECPNGRAIAPPATYLAYALIKARRASTGNARWFRAGAETATAA
jgi:hypothetical protein